MPRAEWPVAVAWFTDSLNWVGLAANFVTVLLVVLGVVATRGWWLALALSVQRWRTVGRPGDVRITLSKHRARTGEWMAGGTLTADGELQWLADVLLGKGTDTSIAFELDSVELHSLSVAYREIAAKLASRTVLGAATIPVVADILRMATDVSNLLSRLASRRESAESTGIQSGGSLIVAHRAVNVVLHVLPDRGARTIARDLVVSYRRHLTAPALPNPAWQDFVLEGGWKRLAADPDELAALATMFSGNQPFDGVLPRLVKWRVEVEPSSGRSRLHLSLAACSYSAVVLDHYPGEREVAGTPAGIRHSQAMGVRNRPVDPNRVDLLTLAMVPVTRDGELIFVRRSSLTGSHQGSFGPAVSGNLELRSRPGVDVDRDRFGVPDPLSALVREAREELGLVVDRGRVFTTGLMTFSNPTEKGTRLLAATTLLDQSLVNIVDGLRAADLIEGRWEVGSSFLAALIPDNRVDLLQLASWLINSDELTPQATAAALASLMVLRDVGDVTSIPITGDVRRPDCVREVST